MKPLTPQQRRVLDLIRRQVAEQGYPPLCAISAGNWLAPPLRPITTWRNWKREAISSEPPPAGNQSSEPGGACGSAAMSHNRSHRAVNFAEENFRDFPLPKNLPQAEYCFAAEAEHDHADRRWRSAIVRRQNTPENGDRAFAGRQATIKRLP